MSYRLGVLGVLAVILLAFALRFHNLGVQSFWNDEGSSYVQATRSFADIAANAARDIHPPGYYWLLAIWRGFTGDTEFALRSLSAFASVLTVAFTYALGKRLFNAPAGLAAALFVALNTFSIYYAQEARMYALLALWGVMGMWALTEVLGATFDVRRQKHVARSTLSLALINAAGLYTQYAYPFVILAQGVIFLVWFLIRIKTGNWKRVTGSYIAANVLTILLYLPWLPTALQQVTQWPSTGQSIPAGEALGTISRWFSVGVTFPFSPRRMGFFSENTFDNLLLLVIGLGYLNILGVFLLILGLLRGFVVSGRKKMWRGGLPLMWVIVPVGLFLMLGLFREANLKLLLPSQIGFALLMGFGAAGWWIGPRSDWLNKVLAITPIISFAAWMVIFILSLYLGSEFQRPDYREMVRQITADPRPGDAVILDAPNQEEVFRYYYRGDAPVYPLPPGLGGDDVETAALTEDIIARHDRIFVLFWGEAERDPNHIVENTLDSQTFQAGIDQWYGDVRFVQYAAPADMPAPTPSGALFGDQITLLGYALSATELQPGDVLQVQLDWRTDAPLTTPYKVFLQLLDSDGVLVAQRDSEPGGGSSPTTSWQPGETIMDRHGLTIPTDLRPGAYKLIVGIYNRDDPAARLPVGAGDYLELGDIQIVD